MVTGGAGFVGSHIVEALVNRGDKVLAYGSYTDPRFLKGLEEKIAIIKGDILDPEMMIKVARENRVQKIIHAAATGWRWGEIADASRILRVNVEGSINVYEIARKLSLERVVDISTTWVYGKTQYQPISEDHPCHPTFPYTISKLASEQVGMYYHASNGLDFVALRISSVYGPRLRPGTTLSFPWIPEALDGKIVRWRSGGDHECNFVHVKDVASGTLLALDADRNAFKHRIFNIVAEKTPTFGEIAGTLRELVPSVNVEFGPGIKEEWDTATGQLSIERASKEMGYAPKYDIRKGLADFIEWYRAKGYDWYR
ncbi:MAG: NAD-dependent epimerase/dehydratase family protein [Candidatus Bathyarchaeia archaeon]